MDVLIRLSNQLFWDIYCGVYSLVKEWYHWGSLEEIGFWIQWNLWFVGYQTDSWLECHSCLGTICKKGWYFRSLDGNKTLYIMQKIYRHWVMIIELNAIFYVETDFAVLKKPTDLKPWPLVVFIAVHPVAKSWAYWWLWQVST